MTCRIVVGHVLDRLRALPDQSVHMAITSPPYYGLRAYGIPPQAWGGVIEGCTHEWAKTEVRGEVSGGNWAQAVNGRGERHPGGVAAVAHQSIVSEDVTTGFCVHCGAWLGQLGLEPTMALYLEHIVDIFREVRRVLRDDGVCWLNIGDSFSSGGRKSYDHDDKLPARAGSFRASGDGLKPKDLSLIPERMALALQDDGWWVRSRVIWCLSGGTRLYARTQKGEMPTTIKDLVRLDPATVQLWNGTKWTQVLGWSETPRPDAPLEIELRNGERIGCTAGHEWPTKRGLVRSDELRVGDVVETTTLPEPANPRMPESLSAEAGWFVGLYLAEGWRSAKHIYISGHANQTERWERLRRFAEMYHGSMVIRKNAGNGVEGVISSPVIQGIVDTYISGVLASGKHLNVRCWQRDRAFLNALLAGYLAGDGHWDEPNSRWRLGFCQNDALAADLRTLRARLGVSLRLKRTTHIMSGRSFPGWRGEVRYSRSDHPNVKQDGEVIAIGRSRARRFWDIGVEDEPHLFALASGVLTHNSKTAPMPESAKDRPTCSHEHIWLLAKSARYFYDIDGYRTPLKESSVNRLTQPTLEEQTGGEKDYAATNGNSMRKALRNRAAKLDKQGAIAGAAPGSASRTYAGFNDRYGQQRKAATEGEQLRTRAGHVTAEMGRMEAQPDRHTGWEEARKAMEGANLRDVWMLNPEPYKGAHYATFPTEIPRRCISLGTSGHGCCVNCGAPWRRVVEHRLAPGPRAAKVAVHDARSEVGAEANDRGAKWSRDGVVPGHYYKLGPSSWEPSCHCDRTTAFKPNDFEVILSPTGEELTDVTMTIGRKGMANEQSAETGVRPITRYEQRMYAAQLRAAPNRVEMEATAGGGNAWDHYLRTDKAGARAVPMLLLEAWIEAGWLTRVEIPERDPYPVAPAVVLDPFGGHCTTGLVAEELGRDSIMIELKRTDAEAGLRRIADAGPLLNKVVIER